MVKKRDKLTMNNGVEIDCNIVGFITGLYGKEIIIYTASDNEKELLASYYTLNEKKFILEEIINDDEWNNLENEFKKLEEELKKK